MNGGKLEICHKETYEAFVQNSVGSSLFNSLFAKNPETNEIEDINGEGAYSCAFFVSNILLMVGILKLPHATVSGLVNKIKSNPNFKEVNINEVKLGDIVVWEKRAQANKTEHEHIGFALNTNEVVSTIDTEKAVVKHKIDYENRKVTAIYSYTWN